MWRELIKKDMLVRRGMGVIGGLILAIAASTWWIGGRVPPEVPLLYSRPWGEGQLVERRMLWWMAGGLGGVGIFGSILGTKMLAGQKATARIVIWAGVLAEVLGLLAVWNVWWRVGV